MRSRSLENMKFGHLLFCRGRERNVPKCKNARAERLFLLIKPIVLCRCRCRCRRRCLSSLVSFSSGNGDGNENVISKYNSSFLYLFIRDYSNLFNLAHAGETVQELNYYKRR